MNINSVGSSTTTGETAGTASGVTARQVGKEFMLLLMAQMRNQNPLEPMNEQEMMAQVTQMNSLEELQRVSSGMEKLVNANQASFAMNLVGKTIRASDANGEEFDGLVTGVRQDSKGFVLEVGNREVTLAEVLEVMTGEAND